MSRRRQRSSPFTLFSFQDIITSVTAIVILMTLMLTLELLSRHETKPGSAATSEEVSRLRAEIEAAATEIDDLQAEIIAHAEAAALSLSLSETEWTDRCEALEEVNRRLEAETEDLISAREVAQVAQRQSDGSAMRSELVERLGELKERRKAAEQELAAIESNDSAIFNVSQAQGKRPWLVDLSADRWIALPAEGQDAVQRFDQQLSAWRRSAFLDWARTRESSVEYFVFLVRPSAARDFLELVSAVKLLGYSIGFDVIGESQDVQVRRRRSQ